ncbi:MAG: S-layer homology domain-containing protein [Firmicutes bacterium]|nr:S-layer homology domain-containing protein [Bacillota bacterium]
MKKFMKNFGRPGIALILTICLVFGLCATGLAAQGGNTKTINLVSFGDSMTNGYGLEGYTGNSGVYDYGYTSYANRFAAYLAGTDFKEWENSNHDKDYENGVLSFNGTNGTVNHYQFAMSGCRAEDLHWLLEFDFSDNAIDITNGTHPVMGNSWNEEVWFDEFSIGDKRTFTDICRSSDRAATAASYILASGYKSPWATQEQIDAAKENILPDENGNIKNPTFKIEENHVAIVAEYYQKAVKEADIISLALGNTNFGTFMFNEIVNATMNGDTKSAMYFDVERALEECTPEVKALVLELRDALYEKLEAYLGQELSYEMPADGSNPSEMDAIANAAVYATISYFLNYAGSVEAILNMNPDVEIIQIALMNTYLGEGNDSEEATIGSLLAVIYPLINGYIAALPTTMKAIDNGQYEDATFYYAEADQVSCMVDVYGYDFYLDKNGEFVSYDERTEDCKANRNSITRKRLFGKNEDNSLTGDGLMKMIDDMFKSFNTSLSIDTGLTFEELCTYDEASDAEKAALAMNPNFGQAKAITAGVYLAFEQATIYSGKNSSVTLEAVMDLANSSNAVSGDIIGNFYKHLENDTAGKRECIPGIIAQMSGGSLNEYSAKALLGDAESAKQIVFAKYATDLVTAGHSLADYLNCDNPEHAVCATAKEAYNDLVDTPAYGIVALTIDRQLNAAQIKYLCDNSFIGYLDKGYTTPEQVVVSMLKASDEFTSKIAAFNMDVDGFIAAGKAGYLASIPVAQAAYQTYYLDNVDSVNTAVAGVTTIRDNKDRISAGVVSANTAINSADSLYMLLSLPDAMGATMIEDSSIMSWMGLYARCIVGTGLGGHPSPDGHVALYDAIVDTWEYGYTSIDKTMDNVINLTKVAIGLLAIYGPEMYNEFMSDPENVAALKQALIDLKAYLETTYPEETETVYDVLRDVESFITYIEENPEEVQMVLDYIYTEATTGEYIRCSDHYYVALGGYTTDDGHYVKAVAENYGIDYKNLGDKKLTFETMEDYIAKNADEIAKASFITYNMDATYFSDHILGFEDQDWARYITDEELTQMEAAKAKVLRLMKRHMDTTTIEELAPTVEMMVYLAMTYGMETVKAVEAIQTINPEATLVVTGMYNPLQGVKAELDGELIDLGKIFDYIIEATDMFYLGYAIADGEVTFVDICDTDVKGLGDVTIEDLNDTAALAKIFYKAESKMHATKDGHAYIAEQIINAINWDDSHTWTIGQIDDDPVHEEYCSVCGAEREPWGDACPFSDISGHWAYNYIRYAYEHNWMNGKGDGIFAPQEASTRAMVVTMLYRLETGAIDTPYEFEGEIPFSDLDKDAWYADAMLWAADNGILSGYEDGTCRPNKVVSREELATFIHRFADAWFLVADDEAEADLTKFSDGEKVQSWAKEAMVWAVDAGVFEGNEDGTLRPAAATTRAELATVFYRFDTKVFSNEIFYW